ncbi:Uncharacterised protein [Acinetobacter baumannii]|nr:Uncharacterised protein [Acinetobacter baumannii]
MAPKYSMYARLMHRQPMVKLRDLNSDKSTTGWSSVSSHTTRNNSATTATTVRVMISVELNQSSSLP